MAPAKIFVPLCALLAGAVLSSVNALGYQEQELRQDIAPGQGLGQGQGDGVSGGGRQGSLGQQGSFGRGAGGFRSGAAEGRSYGESQYGGQPGGEDATRYNFRIYTEPEYYGYESKFPGGKAMFKSYRSATRSSEYGLGRQGPQSEYAGTGRSAKSYDKFGSPGGQQPEY